MLNSIFAIIVPQTLPQENSVPVEVLDKALVRNRCFFYSPLFYFRIQNYNFYRIYLEY